MFEKIKRERSVRKNTKKLKGSGFIKGINSLPKQRLQLKHTIQPSGVVPSYSNPSFNHIKEFWTSPGCKLDRLLYERVINAKNLGH